MATNPMIPMMGNLANPLRAMEEGMRIANVGQKLKRESALAKFAQSEGANVLAGDRGALAKMAGISLPEALNVSQHLLAMDSTRQQMRLREEAARLARGEAARIAKSANAKAEKEKTLREGQELAVLLQSALTDPDKRASLEARHPEMRGADLQEALSITLVGLGEFEAAIDGVAPPDPMEQAELDYKKAQTQKLHAEASQARKPEPSERVARINRLMANNGLTLEQATGVVDGLFVVSRSELDGSVMVVNKGTGETVGSPSGQQGSHVDATPASDSGIPPVDESAGADVSSAFGFEGMAKGAANAVSDFVGAGLPFPDVGEAQADLNLLQDTLLQEVSSAYSRQPPSWLMKSIRENIPKPGGRDGPAAALNKYNALHRNLSRAISQTQTRLNRPMKPAARAEFEARLNSLAGVRSQVEAARNGLQAGDAPSGATPEQIRILNELLTDG